MMVFVLERKAEDWQCDCDCSDYDGWQAQEKSNDKKLLCEKMKELEVEDEESSFRIVKK